MPAHKHFTLSERIDLERYLNSSYSFKAIAEELQRDCTTIAKEVKKHIYHKKTGSYGRAFNNCLYRYDCNRSYICDSSTCKNNLCKFCAKCCSVCEDFKEEKCAKLLKPPYVCNGCKQLKNCRLEKSIYSAAMAQTEYERLRSDSRRGILIDKIEATRLDNFISPLIKNGHSVHHICSNNIDTIMHSEKTIYNYIDIGLFSAKNIDLPRKVRYRPRKKTNTSFKVDTKCRIGRTYQDFITYINDNPDTPVVEMDTVEGVKGGKVLLTIHFTEPQLMLAFIREANTSKSVIDVFESLYLELGHTIFKNLFQLILTDNGSEFSNPSAIEFDSQGNRRSRLFYCNPNSPQQKGAAENNHEFIRRIIPKGTSLNNLTQADINLAMSHINSYGRKKLNNRSPYQIFSSLHGISILKKLNTILIPPNEVVLTPQLLKNKI